MKNFIIFSTIVFLSCVSVQAEVKIYESTDNTGRNKQERIESVEEYLIDLSKSLKVMEANLAENSKKLGAIDSILKVMATDKAAEDKLLSAKLGEKKKASDVDRKDMNEIEKLKADILVLKNEDIEKLKVDFREINETLKALQNTVRGQLEGGKSK